MSWPSPCSPIPSGDASVPWRPSRRRRSRPPSPAANGSIRLIGILFVLEVGISSWEVQPAVAGCGSGVPCWRYLAEGTAAGVRTRLHTGSWSSWGTPRGSIGRSSSALVRGGGEASGPGLVCRRKRGSKHRVVTDGGAVPPAATVTAGNVPLVNELKHVVDAVPPARGKPGQSRRRPKKLYLRPCLRHGIAPYAPVATRHLHADRAVGSRAAVARCIPRAGGAGVFVAQRSRQAAIREGPIGGNPSSIPHDRKLIASAS
jgi:hypothetical protein